MDFREGVTTEELMQAGMSEAEIQLAAEAYGYCEITGEDEPSRWVRAVELRGHDENTGAVFIVPAVDGTIQGTSDA